MKTLFVMLVAFLFAFVIGCQESSITDPTTNEEEMNQFNSNGIEKSSNFYSDEVEVKEAISDPSHPNGRLTLVYGYIKYRVTYPKIAGPGRSIERNAIVVNGFIDLNLDADCPEIDSNMKVTSWFVHKIPFTYTDNLNKSFYRSFKVNGSCCKPLTLIVGLRLTGKVLEVVSLGLLADEV